MIDQFKKKIHNQYLESGNNLYGDNYDIFKEFLTEGTNEYVHVINVGDIEKGKFYFMLYDLQGKSSNMEKFNPLLVVDWIDDKNHRTLFAVSINFMPMPIRVVFFNKLLNYNESIIDANKTTQIDKQKPLQSINFTNVYKLLFSIGFEWNIRQFDHRLINKVYAINTEFLDKFIMMSTAKMTGVDDGKLMEIWLAKIGKQEERQKKMILDLLGDYDKMAKELDEQYINLGKQNDNLENSLTMMKKIFNSNK